MVDHDTVQQIIKKDGPVLTICAALFSYCSLTKIADIMQQVGVIAAGVTAVLVLGHRLYMFWKDAHK